jgi:tetratricopeptide (TPR) repeat protein
MRTFLAAALAYFLLSLAVQDAVGEERPSYLPPPPWVSELALPATLEGARSEPIDILLRDQQLRIEEAVVAQYGRQVIQINSTAGLQMAGNLAFVWNPATDRLIIHRISIQRGRETIDALRGGAGVSVLRREQNLDWAMLDGMLTASIQPAGLQVGDIIDIAITTERADPILAGRAEVMTMLADVPIGRMRFRADWPVGRDLRWRAAPGLGELRRSTSEGRQTISLDQRDVAVDTIAEGAPLRYYERGYIELSEHASFEQVSALLQPHFEAAASIEANSALNAEIARIEAAGQSPRERALLALRLVEEQVRYFYVGLGQGGYVPVSADETWRRRFGDCKSKSVLLAALLRRLGIAAEPALASLTRNDGLETRLPMLQSFDHVIVRAVIDGAVVWLDPTRVGDRALEGAAPAGLRWALPLRSGGAPLEAVIDTLPARAQSTATLEIDARQGLFMSAPARGQMRLSAPGAATFRLAYDSLPAAQREQILRLAWAEMLGWIDIRSASFNFDEATGEALIGVEGVVDLRARDTGPGASFPISGGSSFVPYLAAQREGSASEPPLLVPYPVWAEARILVRLPNGGDSFRFEGEELQRELGPMRLTRRFALSGEEATIDVSFRTLGSEISAAEAHEAHAALDVIRQQVLRLEASLYDHSEADLAALETRGDGRAGLERAIALLNRGELAAARTAFDAILSQNPDDAWALGNRGMVLLWEGETDAAEADFERALTLDPRVYVAYQGRGVLLYERGQYGAAAEAFSTALRLNQTNFARAGRARAYAASGDHARALEDYRALAATAPQSVTLRTAIAESLSELGRHEEARAELDLLTEGLEVGSYEWEEALMLRSSVAAQLGWFDRAIEDANELVRRSAAQVPNLAHRCRMLAAANRELDQALRDCNQSLRLDADFEEALVSRALVRLRRGEFAQAAADYSAALATSPGLAEARYGRGLAYALNGERERAQSDLAAGRAMSSSIEEYFTGLGFDPSASTEAP